MGQNIQIKRLKQDFIGHSWRRMIATIAKIAKWRKRIRHSKIWVVIYLETHACRFRNNFTHTRDPATHGGRCICRQH